MQRLAFASLLLLAACRADADTVQGYVEGDYLRLGLPAGGRLVVVEVRKGQTVEDGAPLFSLDDRAQKAALAEAGARLEQARFQRDNLMTGKRAQEIRAIEAQRAQAQADLALATTHLRRQQALIKTENTTQASLDAARATVARDQARVAEVDAQLALAREGARSAEIAAANAAVDAAEAALAQAQWALDERRATAPQAALVDDVLFRPGEDVTADQPVVSLLPPGNVTLRFFLGPAQVGRLAEGSPLRVACASCPPGLSAHVTFVAHEASYAPPVIYSRENSDKLVFMVEARPDTGAERLHPGQPVTITLPPETE